MNRCFLILTLFAAALVSLGAATLEQDKQFLSRYDKVRQALTSDDLAGAKAAATDLGADAAAVANASSLKDARAGFEKLSLKAESLAAGQSGYHVFHCPMLNKDWVQTSTSTANPMAAKR